MWPCLRCLTQLRLVLGRDLIHWRRKSYGSYLLHLGAPALMAICLLLVGILRSHDHAHDGGTEDLSNPSRYSDKHHEENIEDRMVSKYETSGVLIGYSPINEKTKGFINIIQTSLSHCESKVNVLFKGYDDDDTMLHAYRDHMPPAANNSVAEPSGSKINLGIVFNELKATGTDGSNNSLLGWEVVFRPQSIPGKRADWKKKPTWLKVGCHEHAAMGFETELLEVMMKVVTESIVKKSNSFAPSMSMTTNELHCRHTKYIRIALPLCVVLAFLPGSAALACRIPWKRSKRNDLVMALYGVPQWVPVVPDVLAMLVHIVLVSAILQLAFLEKHVLLIVNHTVALALVFALYGLAANSLALAVSSIAGISVFGTSTLVTVLQAILALPALHGAVLDDSPKRHMLHAISCVSALDEAIEIIMLMERNDHQTVPTNNSFPWSGNHSLVHIFVMLSLQAFSYCLIALGFILVKSLYNGTSGLYYSSVRTSCLSDPMSYQNEKCPLVQLRDVTLNSSIHGAERTLKNLSFDVYPGEKVAILGRHGSGKNSIVQILTGDERSYDGFASIETLNPGVYQAKNPRKIRLCPQYLNLYEKLTVKETLNFFAKLSFCPDTTNYVDRLLSTFKLESVSSSCCEVLSIFGVKRLQIAIASIDDPKLMILDEPTALMDDPSRAATVDMIKSCPGTALICTSSAKVAMQVANRIMLIVQGIAVFVGTKTELMEGLGAGYLLTIGLRRSCNVHALTTYIQLFVPRLYVLKTTPTTLTCMLPDSTTSKFEFFLANLDWKRHRLNIYSFGIQYVSLEDLLEWLPDVRCLNARVKQISACKAAMGEFCLERVLLQCSNRDEPVLVYSALSRSRSTGDVPRLQKELDKIYLNNSNSSPVWESKGPDKHVYYCDSLSESTVEIWTPAEQRFELDTTFITKDCVVRSARKRVWEPCKVNYGDIAFDSKFVYDTQKYEGCRIDPVFLYSSEIGRTSIAETNQDTNTHITTKEVVFFLLNFRESRPNKDRHHIKSEWLLSSCGWGFQPVVHCQPKWCIAHCETLAKRTRLLLTGGTCHPYSFACCSLETIFHDICPLAHASLYLLCLGETNSVAFSGLRHYRIHLLGSPIQISLFYSDVNICKCVDKCILASCMYFSQTKGNKTPFGSAHYIALKVAILYEQRSTDIYFDLSALFNALKNVTFVHVVDFCSNNTFGSGTFTSQRTQTNVQILSEWVRFSKNNIALISKPSLFIFKENVSDSLLCFLCSLKAFASRLIYASPSSNIGKSAFVEYQCIKKRTLRQRQVYPLQRLAGLNRLQSTPPQLSSTRLRRSPSSAECLVVQLPSSAMNKNQSANPESIQQMPSMKTVAGVDSSAWMLLNSISKYQTYGLREQNEPPDNASLGRPSTVESPIPEVAISISRDPWPSTLSVQAMADLEEYMDGPRSRAIFESSLHIRCQPVSGFALGWQRYKALQKKMLVYSARYLKLTVLQLIIPLVIVNLSSYRWSSSNSSYEDKLKLDPCEDAPYQTFSETSPGWSTSEHNLADAFEQVVSCEAPGHLVLMGRSFDNVSRFGVQFRPENYIRSFCVEDIQARVFFDHREYASRYFAIAAVMKAYFRCFSYRDHDYKQADIGHCHNHLNITVPPYQLTIHPLPLETGAFKFHGNASSSPSENSPSRPRVKVEDRRVCERTSMSLTVALSWLSASFIAVLVQERATGFYQLQHLCSSVGIWQKVSQCILHLFIFTLSNGIALFHLTWMQRALFTDLDSLILTLFLYAVSVLPMIYTVHSLFQRPLTALLTMWCLFSVFGILQFIRPSDVGIFSSMGLVDPETHINRLGIAGFPVPSACLAILVYSLCVKGKSCTGHCSKIVSARIRLHFYYIVIHAMLWYSLWAIAQLDCLSMVRKIQLPKVSKMRIDLYRRKKRRASRMSKNFNTRSSLGMFSASDFITSFDFARISSVPVGFKDVWKQSPDRRHKILKNATCSVDNGRCLGVLGTVGSGKTTLLQIIAGLIKPDGGTVSVLPHMIGATNIHYEVQPGLSYCPAEGGLMPCLTARETLKLFGRLRGVHWKVLGQEINIYLDILGLRNVADKKCETYSYTEKAKTRLCAALIGNPNIVVLDEPEQGLNHLELQVLALLLARHRQMGGTIILATEVPEVCEALCTEVVALRNGVLNKIRPIPFTPDPSLDGSRFCQGYLVHMLFKKTEDGGQRSQGDFFTEIAEKLVDVEIYADEQGAATFHLTGREANLAKMFSIMEDGRLYYGIGEYTVVRAGLAYVLTNAFANQETESFISSDLESRNIRGLERRSSSQGTMSTSIV